MVNQENRGRGFGRQGNTHGGRVFVLTGSQKEEEANATLEGTILLSNSEVKVLVDTGASHSFVSGCFAKLLNLESQLLERPFYLKTHLGDGAVVDRIYLACQLLVANESITADLYPLELWDYDLILGMHWLQAYHVVIDCDKREIRIKPPGKKT